jgi:hypothetical protein
MPSISALAIPVLAPAATELYCKHWSIQPKEKPMNKQYL